MIELVVTQGIIKWIIWTVIAGMMLLYTIPYTLRGGNKTLYRVALWTTLLVLMEIMVMCRGEDIINKISWGVGNGLNEITIWFVVDGVSKIFILLTAIIIPTVVISFKSVVRRGVTREEERLIWFLILLMELLIIVIFSVRDIIIFYICFEGILIPMYIIIGRYGSRERKVRAGYLFFIYTLVGSLLMLLGIVVIIVKTGTTNMIEIREIMRIKPMGWEIEKWIWLGFFLSFATKVPMIPLHLWLPEAHVEAPTGGSIVLASILLKLGVYGFYRILIEGMPEVSRYYTPLIYVLGVVGVIYASLTAIRQTDLKRIIAYASIAHMNLVMIGLFSWTIEGVQGALLQSVSHGFVASGLFACVGIIYERYHTRIITYYGGIIEIMPVYGICLLIFMLANISLPGTSSFVGEFLILVGIGKVSIIIMILGGLGVILSAIYSLWVYNRISFGNYKGEYMVEKVEDITGEELSIIIPYIIMIMVIGIWPKMITMYL